jgi:hypothetical protein
VAEFQIAVSNACMATPDRARELVDRYMKAPELTRRNTRVHFIQPLKERILR